MLNRTIIVKAVSAVSLFPRAVYSPNIEERMRGVVTHRNKIDKIE